MSCLAWAGLTPALLAGCWTAPLARTVPPRTTPVRLEGEAHQRLGVIRAVDAERGLVWVENPKGRGSMDRAVNVAAAALERLHPGMTLRGHIREQLVVGAAAAAKDAPDHAGDLRARIASLDISYRRITLAFPDGRQENLRVKDAAVLRGLRLGESVRVTSTELLAG